MIGPANNSMSIDLQKILNLTDRNYRIYDKKNPRENLSDFETFTIRFALNNMPIDELMSFLDDVYGRTDGKSIQNLLSLSVLYEADQFIARLITHPLFELIIKYVDLLIEIVTTLMKNNDTERAKPLIKYLVGAYPFDLKIKALELRLAFAVEGKDKVDELCSSLTVQDYMMEPSLAEFRIYFLCENNRLDDAGALIARYTGFYFLPSSLIGSMIYYCIEREDVVIGRTLLKYWLRPDFCYHDQMQAVLRMIDSANSAKELVDNIESVDGWYRYPDLIACREAVCSLYNVGGISDELEQDLRGNLNEHDALPKSSATKNVILFCIDKPYRIPALVAIFGVVREMSHCSEKPVIALFLPELEVPFWKNISNQLSTFSEWPEFLLIHENMPEITKSREHYGCLSLRKLPTMAYGRLFAIKMLSRLGYAKLLYLDADIVVVNDLMPIFSIDQLGYPVSGAIDRPVDQITKAMKIHGIVNNKYLNSGVMLFDLKHPATEVIIKAAIHYVLTPEVKLVFHDQCAINKALKGHFHPLPRKYNNFLYPGMITQRENESVIFHFIDAPKPWDVAHRGGSAIDLWRKHLLLAKIDCKKFGLHELESVSAEMMLDRVTDRSAF